LKREVAIGARDSVLALWQARRVMEDLQEMYPGCVFRTVGIKTLGDRVQDVALARIGDRGLFTKELEAGLLRGEIDLAVHSMKDLPTRLPEGLTIGAIGRREWPGDVLISRRGLTLEQLPEGSSVGTSSLRRASQLLRFRPDLKIISVRGNLTTRLRKLSEHDLDALVLAFAGVNRLEYNNLITQKIPYAICLPAAGQGSIGVEIRMDDARMQEMVARLDDPDPRLAITAERALMKELEGGCQVPVGALGEVEGGRLTLEGMVLTLNGQRFVRDRISGPKEEAAVLGRELAQKLLAQGAGEILKSARGEFEDRC
jgi:hydroxymethylbilane synthase